MYVEFLWTDHVEKRFATGKFKSYFGVLLMITKGNFKLRLNLEDLNLPHLNPFVNIVRPLKSKKKKHGEITYVEFLWTDHVEKRFETGKFKSYFGVLLMIIEVNFKLK
jgi:hypothetical protein